MGTISCSFARKWSSENVALKIDMWPPPCKTATITAIVILIVWNRWIFPKSDILLSQNLYGARYLPTCIVWTDNHTYHFLFARFFFVFFFFSSCTSEMITNKLANKYEYPNCGECSGNEKTRMCNRWCVYAHMKAPFEIRKSYGAMLYDFMNGFIALCRNLCWGRHLPRQLCILQLHGLRFFRCFFFFFAFCVQSSAVVNRIAAILHRKHLTDTDVITSAFVHVPQKWITRILRKCNKSALVTGIQNKSNGNI